MGAPVCPAGGLPAPWPCALPAARAAWPAPLPAFLPAQPATAQLSPFVMACPTAGIFASSACHSTAQSICHGLPHCRHLCQLSLPQHSSVHLSWPAPLLASLPAQPAAAQLSPPVMACPTAGIFASSACRNTACHICRERDKKEGHCSACVAPAVTSPRCTGQFRRGNSLMRRLGNLDGSAHSWHPLAATQSGPTDNLQHISQLCRPTVCW